MSMNGGTGGQSRQLVGGPAQGIVDVAASAEQKKAMQDARDLALDDHYKKFRFTKAQLAIQYLSLSADGRREDTSNAANDDLLELFSRK